MSTCCCSNPNRCCRECRGVQQPPQTYTNIFDPCKSCPYYGRIFDPCKSCPHYGRAFWSIVSPCQGCPHNHAAPYTVTYTTSVG